MQTKLSSKGQVVLPQRIRQKLGLRSGDALDAKVQGASIVLTPRRKRNRKARIITDPRTGFPVITMGPGAPTLTSEQVHEILSDFP